MWRYFFFFSSICVKATWIAESWQWIFTDSYVYKFHKKSTKCPENECRGEDYQKVLPGTRQKNMLSPKLVETLIRSNFCHCKDCYFLWNTLFFATIICLKLKLVGTLQLLKPLSWECSQSALLLRAVNANQQWTLFFKMLSKVGNFSQWGLHRFQKKFLGLVDFVDRWLI